MKHILFFIPTLSNGGAERVLCNLVNKLCLIEDFDISVLTLFKDDRSKLLYKIKYSYVFSFKFRGNVHLLKIFPAVWLYNWMIGKDHRYDIVVSFLQSPTMRIVGACNNPFVKKVNWIHNEFHSLDQLASIYRSTQECVKSLTSYDATVYVANSAKEAMEKCLPVMSMTKSFVIYNVNDFDSILQKAEEKVEDGIFNNETFNIISVGRFTKQKGFDRLIRTIKFLKDRNINAELYLLGDGILKNEYLSIAKNLGVKEKLHLLGFKTNPFKYVKGADLFVCSSLHEGYSTAVTESLIVGTPVVTTMCSGMLELLGDSKYGVICKNEDDSLQNTVLELIKDLNKYNYYKVMAARRGKELMSLNNLNSVIKLFNNLGKDEN